MPKGNSPFTMRTTESVARETITGLFLEVLDLTRSTDPRAWEMAAIKLDDAADAARTAERSLTRRREGEDAFLAFPFAHIRPHAPSFTREDPAQAPRGADHQEAVAAIIRGLTGGRR